MNGHASEAPLGPIAVMSTLALAGAMRELTPQFEAAAGEKIEAAFAPTAALLSRIAAGETADIAILTAEAIDALTRAGTLAPGSRTDLARSVVGVAVRAGGPRPDISSVEAFKRTLLEAGSIAYSRAGASGIFFADLIQRLGIADEVNAKATVIPTGFTGELAARGEVEIAIQQISELMMAAGIDIVGPLPSSIQSVTTFSAGIFASSGRPTAARTLIRFLSASEARAVLARNGLEPPDRGEPDR